MKFLFILVIISTCNIGCGADNLSKKRINTIQSNKSIITIMLCNSSENPIDITIYISGDGIINSYGVENKLLVKNKMLDNCDGHNYTEYITILEKSETPYSLTFITKKGKAALFQSFEVIADRYWIIVYYYGTKGSPLLMGQPFKFLIVSREPEVD